MPWNLAFCPIEICLDSSLTLIELRILIALYSFRNKNTELVWPSRKALMQKTGYQAPQTISKAITGLSAKGWVDTKQNRGPNHYTLHVPERFLETVTDSDTVTEPVTVTEPDLNSNLTGNSNRTGYSNRIGTETVTEPVTPEHTKNIPIEKDIEAKLSEFSPPPAGRNSVPYGKIVDLYHEKLPELPRIAKLTDARKAKIRARHGTDFPTLENWGEYFEYVRESKFLMGLVGGERKFRATLDFLINESSAVKICEGKYHD